MLCVYNLLMHNEVDDVDALYRTAAGEAVSRIGVGIDLHRGLVVIVEGAGHRAGGSDGQAIVVQNGGDGEGGFDLRYRHAAGVFSVFLSTEEKIGLSRIGEKSTGCVTTTQHPCRLFLTFTALIFA